jgi:acyl homoserine lactone synthase
MIDAVTYETAHLLGDILPGVFRLRYELFVEREGYNVPNHAGMEWDQFDTPVAVYLVSRNPAGQPRAVARLIPTTFPYMLRELWPHLVSTQELPSRPDCWELTRFGVSRSVPAELRRQVVGELVCGVLEFGLLQGVSSFLHVAHPAVFESVLIEPGCTVAILGERRRLGRLPVVPARLEVNEDTLVRVRQYHGLQQPVLRLVREAQALAA